MRRTNKPVVNNDGLFGIADVVPPADTISVGSESWFTWLTDHDGFVYEGKSGHLTARSELRRGIRYWYGHRRREGKLAKTYLGKSDELTLERLEQASAILAGKSPMGQAIEYFASEAPGIIFGSDGITGIPSNTTLKEGLYQPLTKFKPPVLPQKLIARPRLSARINAPATLISAPSGFGKTTLVNEWRVSCGMPVAWVTLSPDDNQPQRFWATVVMALQTIDPIIGKDCQSQLHSTSHNEFLNSVTNLNNDIVRVGEKMNDRTLCLV
ncbi:MAG TPA: hypothetical protein VN376_09130, partial [Longilinea sp.]|nr:hypothetical protein [Longilinea sp.]